MKSLSGVSPAAMSLLQHQIFSQYALINGLVDNQTAKLTQPNPPVPATAIAIQPPNPAILAGHPAFMLQEQVSTENHIFVNSFKADKMERLQTDKRTDLSLGKLLKVVNSPF